ncbi:unnamed protein product [Blepharisma stoltei]|uniref:Uncharacterized protein n=1 Tax=Blepharisma stoltei TaxID=1481888 RepID=A0AAU9JN60_9CILI|nr:unnamed protein product [Blepharisma stoltei]
MSAFMLTTVGLSLINFLFRMLRKKYSRLSGLFGESLVARNILIYINAYIERFIEQLSIKYKYQKERFEH